MSSLITPNMSLVVPIVGQEPGPEYATDVNASLNIIDSHNHTPGYGVPIPTAGLNINTDLPINGNRLTGVKSIPFTSQVSPLTAVSPDIDALYVSGVDLYYNDGNGNQIRVTEGGAVTGSPGSITGLTPPASASYSSGSETFVWQSDVNTPANMDMGSIILRDITANSHGITISPAAGLAGDYTLTLPGGLPGSQATVEVSSGGVISFVPNTTAAGPVISSSSGSFSSTGNSRVLITNFTISITTLGGPVMLGFTSDGTGSACSIGYSSVSGDSAAFYIYRGTNPTGTEVIQTQLASSTDTLMEVPPGGVSVIDIVSAGTYTYNGYVQGTISSTVLVTNCSMYAYELKR